MDCPQDARGGLVRAFLRLPSVRRASGVIDEAGGQIRVAPTAESKVSPMTSSRFCCWRIGLGSASGANGCAIC
jgi:hypothetical protein